MIEFKARIHNATLKREYPTHVTVKGQKVRPFLSVELVAGSEGPVPLQDDDAGHLVGKVVRVVVEDE
jgi:hypothetical protein